MKSKTRSASGQGTRGSGFSATPGSAAKSRDVDVDVACTRNGAGHLIGASVAPSTREPPHYTVYSKAGSLEGPGP